MARAIGWWSRLGLSLQILIGLGLGLLLGLFLGEPAGVLQPLSDLYIRLMQMTVVPYLVLALIVGLGQLDAAHAKTLAIRAGALLLVFWALAIAVVGAMPWAFPAFESASFFSHTLIEPEQPFSLAETFVPSNPFHSLANTVIPAVVLFSGAIGIGLIGVPGKERVLDALRVLSEAISRVTKFVVSLTPFGVFAIGAVTAGTMSLETLARLEVYLIAFAVASLLLAFVILPLCATALTRFGYREVVGVARDALLTAFVANNVFIVLPILIERAKELFARHGMLEEDSESAIEVIVPVFFNFPNAGKMLTLLFVPFGAWLAGSPLLASQYPELFASGIPSYFAKAQIALPFLMDLMGVPHDLFQLYIPTTILTGKFDSLVAAMNLLVFALLGGAAMSGGLEIRAARVVRAVLLAAGSLVAAVVATTFVLRAFAPEYTKDEQLLAMDLAADPVAKVVHSEVPEREEEPGGLGGLERIRARGTLRVGYVATAMPFSFFNDDGDLVGYDVQLAESLAEALGVGLEFVPAELGDIESLVEEGAVDLLVTLALTPERIGRIRFSQPHIEGTMAFVVRDERRQEFASDEALGELRTLTLGRVGHATFGEEELRRRLGGTRLEVEHLDSPEPFFAGERPELDALFVAAEVGAAWSLLHPQFAVVVPRPDPLRVPAGVALPLGERELADYVDAWLVIERSSGRLQRAYDYWVLGRGAAERRPRWSILRDVLGWDPDARAFVR